MSLRAARWLAALLLLSGASAQAGLRLQLDASGLSSANSGNAGAKPFFDLKAGIGSVDVMFTGNAAQAE